MVVSDKRNKRREEIDSEAIKAKKREMHDENKTILNE